MKKVTAIVFIKKDSERILKKNFRLFNGRPLFTIILNRLNEHKLIDKILVDSDSPEVLNFVSSLNKGVPIERPEYLYGGHITANEIIPYDIKFSDSDHFFETHVTNPLLTHNTITNSIQKYFSILPQYDSLFSVTRIQQRVFLRDGSPLNHPKGELLRTQDLNPVFHENSSFFIFSRNSFIKAGNHRVGELPFLYEIPAIEALDIDYEDEFLLAELVDKNKALFPDIFKESN